MEIPSGLPNKQYKYAFIWLSGLLLILFMILIEVFFWRELPQTVNRLIFFGSIIAAPFLIVFAIKHFVKASALNHILKDKDFLFVWNYNKKDWQEFIESGFVPMTSNNSDEGMAIISQWGIYINEAFIRFPKIITVLLSEDERFLVFVKSFYNPDAFSTKSKKHHLFIPEGRKKEAREIISYFMAEESQEDNENGLPE